MVTTLVLTLAGYFIITLVIGLAKTRRQSASEFIVAPNSIGTFPTLVSLLGTIVGGGMFLGIAQLGFESVMSAFALGIAYLVGSIVFSLLAPSLRRYAREHNVRTLFGVFDAIYGNATVGFSLSRLFSLMTLLVFFLMLAVQFIGIGSFFTYFSEIHFNLALLLGAAIVAVLSTLVYSVVGGFKRDVYTDIVQVFLIVIGLVPVVIGLMGRDIGAGLRELPAEVFEVGGDHLIFFVGSLLFVAPTFLVRFDLWQRAIAAKSDGAARAAFLISGVLSFFFFILFGAIGLFARIEGLPDSEFVGLAVIDTVVPPQFLGLALAAFFAAVMSSADTFLGVSGLALARGSVYKRGELESPENGNASVYTMRRLVLLVGLLSLGIAFLIRDIVDLFASAFGILMVFLPALIGGLTRKSPGVREAKASIVAGLVVVIPLIFVIPTEAFLPGIVVSLVTYLVLSRSGRGEAR